MKKVYVPRFVRGFVTVVSAASFVFTVGAYAGEMKSDPDNYYLDPEEIRPYVRDNAESTIIMNSQHEGETTFSGVETFDIRLIAGQIPMYTIDGDVAAYLYIAYAIPGPLPTLEEIISAARESYDVVQKYRYDETPERENWREFYSRVFPYKLTCAYEFVGISAKWPSTMGSCGVPELIMKRKAGDEAARRYFGSGEFELVRYIYCSKLNGYEYSDGRENIIVPFDTLTGEVKSRSVMKRADVDANLDEYIWVPSNEGVEQYFDIWRDRLSNGTSGSMLDDSPTEDYTIPDMGCWCYLHQQYYDNRDYVWKDCTGLWDYEGKVGGHKDYPLLKRRVTEPKQWALFGRCWGIAAASNLAYLEGTGTARLKKNKWEGKKVRGVDTTEEKFPYPAMRELNKTKEQLTLPPYPNNYTAYMSLLIGALYQHEPAGCSFFYRQQDIQAPTLPFIRLAEACAAVLTWDFHGCSQYYDVWYGGEKFDPVEAAIFIYANNPFVINYNHPEHGWHAVTCYGYRGFDYGQNKIREIGFWDWYDSDDWPDTIPELKWKSYTDEFFHETMVIRDRARKTVVSYVRAVDLTRDKNYAKILWTSTPVAEPKNLAVEPGTGVIWVSDGAAIERYAPSGEWLDDIPAAGFEFIDFGADGAAAFIVDKEGYFSAYNADNLTEVWREQHFGPRNDIHLVKYNDK